MVIQEVRRDLKGSVLKILEVSEIPSPPYTTPENVVKALSVSMGLEAICRSNDFLSLSAPQVGIPWNLFVFWRNYPEKPHIFSCFVDCECVGIGEKMLSLESCASHGSDRFGVMRHPSIEVSGSSLVSDHEGKMRMDKIHENFSGVLAAVIQHESDHLKGVSLDGSGERIFFR